MHYAQFYLLDHMSICLAGIVRRSVCNGDGHSELTMWFTYGTKYVVEWELKLIMLRIHGLLEAAKFPSEEVSCVLRRSQELWKAECHCPD